MEPFIRACACRVLDTHVGPRSGINDRVYSRVMQITFESGGFPCAHRHFFDD